MHKASEDLSDQITNTGNAQNQSRRKFFAIFHKADFQQQLEEHKGEHHHEAYFDTSKQLLRTF
jgi:hypothetical protein